MRPRNRGSYCATHRRGDRHGHVRTTNDADLIPAPDPDNLERLAATLRALDARVLNPGEEDTEIDAKMLPRETIWQFVTRDGGIDVMLEVPGGRPYADLSKRALRVRLGDVEVPWSISTT